MEKIVFALVLIFFVSIYAVGQGLSDRLFLEAGIIARSTSLFPKDQRMNGPIYTHNAPYNYKAGIHGTGINGTLGYVFLENINLNLLWGTTIRYDFFYYDFECDCNRKTFYVDQSLAITKGFQQKYYLGIGFSIYNIGRKLNYMTSGNKETLQLEFNSIDFILARSIWKIYIEVKLSVIHKNFPGTFNDNATMLGGRLFYRF